MLGIGHAIKKGFRTLNMGSTKNFSWTAPASPRSAFATQKHLIPDARIIFDGGANVGDTVHEYRGLYPLAKIHAFEPTPEVLIHLTDRFRDDNNIICNGYALTSQDGAVTLHRNSLHYTNALSPFVRTPLRPVHLDSIDKVEVEAVSLDSYSRQRNIEAIDILKLDTQGAELDILRGASGLLSRRGIGLIYTEVCFVDLYERQGKYYEIFALLASLGYDLFDFFDPKKDDSSGRLLWADAIFIPARSQIQ